MPTSPGAPWPGTITSGRSSFTSSRMCSSWIIQSGTLVPSAKKVWEPGQTVSATWSTLVCGNHAMVTSSDSPATVVLSVNSKSCATVEPSHSSLERTNVLCGTT